MERLLAALGLLLLFVVFSPLVNWYAGKLARPWSRNDGDIMVVLSAAEPNEGVIDISTYWRCYMALVYYREHPYREVIVTGRNSAAGMRDFLVFNGVPADRIRLEDQATSTRENAEFTARMLGRAGLRIAVVTSDSHMFRARRAFAKAGFVVSALVAPDVGKRADHFGQRPELFVDEMEETAGIIYYWCRGWI